MQLLDRFVSFAKDGLFAPTSVEAHRVAAVVVNPHAHKWLAVCSAVKQQIDHWRLAVVGRTGGGAAFGSLQAFDPAAIAFTCCGLKICLVKMMCLCGSLTFTRTA